MEIIEGKFGKAKLHGCMLDEKTRQQVVNLCDQEFTSGLDIAIMPDAHAGKGCVIGTTMTLNGKIVPNLVGVDIGCGMETIKLAPCEVDFRKLDKFIKHRLPHGTGVNKHPHPLADQCRLDQLACHDEIFSGEAAEKSKLRALRSVGSLGSGNHFIEVDKDADTGELYLVIHSGSRNPGLSVAELYQKKARASRGDSGQDELAWLEGEDYDAYMHDMQIMQEFADLNRQAMAQMILEYMDWKAQDRFATIHNYVNFEDNILRKGAVSSRKGEKLLVPFNMRDGSVICEGLGNPDWNCSAPHGAGRAASRQQAFKTFDLAQFKADMEGIYSTCVSRSTIDESPAAYKPAEQIIEALPQTAKILHILKPIYNFKSGA